MPTKSVTRFYWDSCVFLSAIDGDADRSPVIEQLMLDCDAGKHEIYTSHLSITEVCFAKTEKAKRQLSDQVEERINALWSAGSPVKLIEVHHLIVVEAKRLIRDSLALGIALKPADAIHLATALIYKVDALHTYDAKLMKHGPRSGLPVKQPELAQFVFGMQMRKVLRPGRLHIPPPSLDSGRIRPMFWPLRPDRSQPGTQPT